MRELSDRVVEFARQWGPEGDRDRFLTFVAELHELLLDTCGELLDEDVTMFKVELGALIAKARA